MVRFLITVVSSPGYREGLNRLNAAFILLADPIQHSKPDKAEGNALWNQGRRPLW